MLKKFIHITRRYAPSKLRTLTVSDGDLGYAASIATRFVDGRDLTATTYDSYDDLLKIYPEAKGNLERLKSSSVNMIHNLAVQNLSTDKRLAGKKFHRIINNFPHSGFVKGLSETQLQMIKRHQDFVISPFLQHAAKMLYPNGQIHITH
ncbi:heavy metal-associated isoprenylated plant protein 41 isoform X1 [Tanacetum coccineum]